MRAFLHWLFRCPGLKVPKGAQLFRPEYVVCPKCGQLWEMTLETEGAPYAAIPCWNRLEWPANAIAGARSHERGRGVEVDLAGGGNTR